MEHTIERLTKVLGASAIESAGHGTRFLVEGKDGARLQVSVEAAQQRVMAVLKDASGTVRSTLDLAPVRHVTEHKRFPHRVTLHVGQLRVQIDAAPTLAVEIVTEDGEEGED
jgi:hypothetical protein